MNAMPLLVSMAGNGSTNFTIPANLTGTSQSLTLTLTIILTLTLTLDLTLILTLTQLHNLRQPHGYGKKEVGMFMDTHWVSGESQVLVPFQRRVVRSRLSRSHVCTPHSLPLLPQGPGCSPAYPSLQTVRWTQNKYSALSSTVSSSTSTR